METLRRALVLSLSGGVPRRALIMALVIGTILNLINQGDALLTGAAIHWGKLALTYLTPYIVSTHGAVAARLSEAP
jgi:hypothetical protein